MANRRSLKGLCIFPLNVCWLACVVGILWQCSSVRAVYATESETALWRVSGNGLKHSSYLFATLDSRDARAFTFNDSVAPAFARCDVLALPFDYDSAAAGMIHILKDYDEVAGGRTMDAILNVEQCEYLIAMIGKHTGLSDYKIKASRPHSLLSRLHNVIFEQDFKFEPQSLFYILARRQNKTTVGLRSFGDLYNSDKYGRNLQAWSDLFEALEDFDNTIDLHAQLMQAYSVGDLAEVMKILRDEPQRFQMHNYLLGEAQSAQLFERTLELIQANSTFVVLHAVDILGANGLRQAFVERGFIVEPVIAGFEGVESQLDTSAHQYEWDKFENESLGLEFAFPTNPSTDLPPELDLSQNGLAGEISADFTHGTVFLVISVPIPNYPVDRVMSVDQLKGLNSDLMPRLTKTKDSTAWNAEVFTSGELEMVRTKTKMPGIGTNAEFGLFVRKGAIVILMAISTRQNTGYTELAQFFDSIRALPAE